MQGAELIDVRFEEGNNILYVLGTSPAVPTIITSLGGDDTFHFGYDVSQQPRKVLDVLGPITINAGAAPTACISMIASTPTLARAR